MEILVEKKSQIFFFPLISEGILTEIMGPIQFFSAAAVVPVLLGCTPSFGVSS